MKVYVIKTAFTDGIYPCEGSILENGNFKGNNYYQRFSKNDFCLSIEEAVEKVKEMRLKRIESLRKQLEKLDNPDYEFPVTTGTTVYLTKYALTQGILACKGSILESGNFKGEGYQHYDKNDFCLSIEEAVNKSHKMRLERIESLRKQLEKLDNPDYQVSITKE